MKQAETIKKLYASTARILSALALVLGIPALAYWIWSPGNDQTLSCPNNAIWLGHGWLGADSWFQRYHKKQGAFREDSAIQDLLKKLSENHIRYVYPHLCPAQFDGNIAEYDDPQIMRFSDAASTAGIRVLPWVGGVLNESARISDPKWRKQFSLSIKELLAKHPRLAGIHINIEPLPDGERDFILLLDEVKASVGDKILSVAAYPPPTVWQQSPNVHWSLDYIREVAGICDQFVVMMYDTAIPLRKCYIFLMKQWTDELISTLAQAKCEVLLGIPAYKDAGVGYHHPDVENMATALQGIRASEKSDQVSGIAIYCEWEMTPEKWLLWQKKIVPPSKF